MELEELRFHNLTATSAVALGATHRQTRANKTGPNNVGTGIDTKKITISNTKQQIAAKIIAENSDGTGTITTRTTNNHHNTDDKNIKNMFSIIINNESDTEAATFPQTSLGSCANTVTSGQIASDCICTKINIDLSNARSVQPKLTALEYSAVRVPDAQADGRSCGGNNCSPHVSLEAHIAMT